MKKILIILSFLVFCSSFSYGREMYKIGKREFKTMSDMRKHFSNIKKNVKKNFPKHNLKVELEKVGKKRYIVKREATIGEAGVRGSMIRIVPHKGFDDFGNLLTDRYKKCNKKK